MATIKVKFRASSVEMKEGSLYYQVIHNRLARQVHTGYKLFPSEWDAGISEIVMDSGTEGGAQELPALREDCPSRKLVPFEKHHRTAGMFLESLSSSRPCFETINIYVSDACIVSFIHKPKSVSLAAFSSLSYRLLLSVFFTFLPFLVDIVPFVTFPIVVFSVRTRNFFHLSLVRYFSLAVLEWEAEGEAGLDDRPAAFVRVPDTPSLVHDTVQSLADIIVAIVTLKHAVVFHGTATA